MNWAICNSKQLLEEGGGVGETESYAWESEKRGKPRVSEKMHVLTLGQYPGRQNQRKGKRYHRSRQAPFSQDKGLYQEHVTRNVDSLLKWKIQPRMGVGGTAEEAQALGHKMYTSLFDIDTASTSSKFVYWAFRSLFCSLYALQVEIGYQPFSESQLIMVVIVVNISVYSLYFPVMITPSILCSKTNCIFK